MVRLAQICGYQQSQAPKDSRGKNTIYVAAGDRTIIKFLGGGGYDHIEGKY